MRERKVFGELRKKNRKKLDLDIVRSSITTQDADITLHINMCPRHAIKSGNRNHLVRLQRAVHFCMHVLHACSERGVMGTCREPVYGSLLFLRLYPAVRASGPIL